MLLNASGCLDALIAPDVARSLDVFVTKTVTPLPREGNAPPRIAEVEHGMLNSIGLANPGIDRFLAHTLPRLGELGVPVWVSVGAFAVADYAELCDGPADRRHGRRGLGSRRARARLRGCRVYCARHDPFLRPRCARTHQSRACKRDSEPGCWRARQRNRPCARPNGREFRDRRALRSDVCTVNILQIAIFPHG